MAIRRMFSRVIISSAKFIKMPHSTQVLYFHLIMNGDDDGVVEAFPIMRMIGSSEDDIKILSAKKFIVILNDDLVSFITDWNEHNLIRADRKVDSKYKDLLIQVIGDVNLLEMSGKCQANVSQMPVKCQHRIGKDRIGKDRIGKDRKEKDILVPDAEHLELALLLKSLILKNNPKSFIKDSQIKSWADTVRLMTRKGSDVDNRTLKEIRELIIWSQNDPFWQKNILSMQNLREKFDRLTMQKKKKETTDLDFLEDDQND